MELDKPLILFDGDCLMCHSLVKFLVVRDNDGFYYASLTDIDYSQYQSLNSVVVITKDQTVFIKSAAIFEIVKVMDFPWRWLSIFKIVPRFLLDFGYSLVAFARKHLSQPISECDINKDIQVHIKNKMLKFNSKK